MVYRLLFFFAVCVFGIKVGYAREINCNLANTKTEIQICKSPPLMSLDKELNKWYPLAKGSQINSYNFIQKHLVWLKSRSECDSEMCLITKYKEWISELKNYPLFTSVNELSSLENDKGVEVDVPLNHKHSKAESISGTDFKVGESKWLIKPFFGHANYINLLSILKDHTNGVVDNYRLISIISAVNTNDDTYIYLLLRLTSDKPSTPSYWGIIQYSEGGDIKVIDVSKNQDCQVDSTSVQTHFYASGDYFTFINNADCVPTVKQWSISKSMIITPTKSNRDFVVGNIDAAKWNGICGNKKCFSYQVDTNRSHLGFHLEDRDNNSRNEEKYSIINDGDLNYYGDGIYLIQPSGKSIHIINSNTKNRNSWYLQAWGNSRFCSESDCLISNAYGDFGIWEINFNKKYINRILPVKYIDNVYSLSTKDRRYVFFNLGLSNFNIYVATSG
jgi:uncharacterized protein